MRKVARVGVIACRSRRNLEEGVFGLGNPQCRCGDNDAAELARFSLEVLGLLLREAFLPVSSDQGEWLART